VLIYLALSRLGVKLKILKYILFCALLFLPSTLFGWSGKVISVYDGDTITVSTMDNQKVKIRLYGIDAPELKKQPYGKASRNFLERQILNKYVEVTDLGKDMYNRTVAKIYYKNEYINLKSIQAGMSWHYSAYSKDLDLKEAQETAKLHEIGLWRGELSVAPWEWRALEKKRRLTF
jgi:endonuclease YncB( thermonuclease family)